MVTAYISVLILVGLLALVMMPILYVYALAFGPAVKHWGRKWEEGRQDAVVRRAWLDGKQRLATYERTKPPGETLTKEQKDAVERGAAVIREAPAQYTITGRKIR